MRSTLSFARYLRWFFCSSFVVLFGIIAAVFIVDPDAENNPPTNHLKSFRYSILTTNRFLDQLKEKPHTLVFGTSRSLLMSPEILGTDVITNDAIYGFPLPVLEFLKHLDSNQLSHVREIYYLLDFHVFNRQPPSVDYTDRLQYWSYRFAHLNIASITESWDKLYKNYTGAYDFYLDEHGYRVPLGEERASGNIPESLWYRLSERKSQEFLPESVALLGEIQAFVHSHNIKITYLTGTVTPQYLAILDMDKLSSLYHEYLKYIAGFYSLIYVDQFGKDMQWFANMTHLNKKAIKMVMQPEFLKNYYVDSSNIDAHMQSLRAKLKSLDVAVK